MYAVWATHKDDCLIGIAEDCLTIADVTRPITFTQRITGLPEFEESILNNRFTYWNISQLRLCDPPVPSDQNPNKTIGDGNACLFSVLYFTDLLDGNLDELGLTSWKREILNARGMIFKYSMPGKRVYYETPEPDKAALREERKKYIARACALGFDFFHSVRHAIDSPLTFCNSEEELDAACVNGDGEACYRKAMIFLKHDLRKYQWPNASRDKEAELALKETIWQNLRRGCDLNHAQACVHFGASYLTWARDDRLKERIRDTSHAHLRFTSYLPRESSMSAQWASENNAIADQYLVKGCSDLEYGGQDADLLCAGFR